MLVKIMTAVVQLFLFRSPRCSVVALSAHYPIHFGTSLSTFAALSSLWNWVLKIGTAAMSSIAACPTSVPNAFSIRVCHVAGPAVADDSAGSATSLAALPIPNPVVVPRLVVPRTCIQPHSG